jgi:hypothetical protein
MISAVLDNRERGAADDVARSSCATQNTAVIDPPGMRMHRHRLQQNSRPDGL